MKLWQLFLMIGMGCTICICAQEDATDTGATDLAADAIEENDTDESAFSESEMDYEEEDEETAPPTANATDTESADAADMTQDEDTAEDMSTQEEPEDIIPLNQSASEEEPSSEQEEPLSSSQPEQPIASPEVDLAKPVEFEDLGPVELPQPKESTMPSAQPVVEDKEAEELPVTPPEPVDYGEGIDTLDIDSSGNWLQKRVIWEDAQDKYEEIKDLMDRVIDARMSFFTQRNAIDKTSNLFFIDIGFAQGELEEIIDELIKQIEMDRLVQGDLDQAEREIKATLAEKKQEIQQLRLDLKSISELDEALDAALLELMKQINLCHDYEGQAWDKFKAIGQELDDQKAKEHYLYMDALLKNIQAIYQYITGPYNQYFSSSISKINSHMDTIRSSINSLKESGVAIQKKIDPNSVEQVQAGSVQKETKPEELKKGWFASIKGVFSSTGSWISDTASRSWTWVISWFRSAAPKAETSR
ncbi:hypothetical protein JW872_03465 [Candidatus Babeliales bacterium]|nr:hypothetical protein [Candidatus Babeliales bacterium]